MPVYFAHGFRWPRAGFTGIRVHIIFENLENASAEYIQTPDSEAEIFQSFRHKWPAVMKELEGPGGRGLTLLEEYDPEDETSDNSVSRPWAFVCDCVKTLPTGKSRVDVSNVRTGKAPETQTPRSSTSTERNRASRDATQSAPMTVTGPALSLNITETIAQGPGSTSKAWEALADLRDSIAPGEKIDWWIVYNGDPVREYGSTYEEDDDDEDMTNDAGDEVYEEVVPNRSTFVSQGQSLRRDTSPVAVLAAAQAPRASSKDMMPPPERPPAKDKDRVKRAPGMRAFPPSLDKPTPPLPTQQTSIASKAPPKSEGGLKKKLFGKK